jgi:NADPH-dependent ferric siderophore reductase
MMSTFTCEADIRLARPRELAGRLFDAAAALDIHFTRRGDRADADLGFGAIVLTILEDRLAIRAEAGDWAVLERLRAGIAERILELAGDERPVITWSGDAARSALFADFRELRVVSARDLSPHMRRLTFRGHDLGRFDTRDDLHARLYFPPEGVDPPEWPRPGPDGRPVWPEAGRRPDVRYYTIRRIDAAAGEIDIDFVMHADGGPGAGFAARARPGDVCGISGPCGLGISPASWYLLAGDETALPAIARILESLPADARGRVFVEVAGPQDELALRVPPGMTLSWLHRGGAPAGSPELLTGAVRSLAWPDLEDVFVWIACEFEVLAALRTHLRGERGIPRDRMLLVPYWRRSAAPAGGRP